MATLEVLLFILFVVTVVTAIAENINVPYPILLVITGLLVGLIPNMPNWEPPNNLILSLFLPPILFSAARTITWHDIKQNLIPIFSLAFLLVIVTAISIAGILDWTIGPMDFGTALVLGAIIAPTDIVAAHSILAKLHVKSNIIRTIKVESLFNDACSILLYKTGMVLVLTHSVSFNSSSLNPGSAITGVLIGLGFAYIANVIIKNFLTSSENNLPIIMSLILAYVSYLLAEEVGASSVLAVVSAGLYYKKTTHTIRATTRLAEKVVWDTLLFFLNGLIFLAIGSELPSFLHKVSYLPATTIALFSAVTITAVLGLRFFWVNLTDYFNQLWEQRKTLARRHIKLQWRENLVVTWSGMRGLVSITLALALPITLATGAPFPERNLVIVLTIITIWFTVVVQGLTLPLLVKILKVRKSSDSEARQTRELYQKLTRDALSNIETFSHHPELHSEKAKELVANHYTSRLLGMPTHHHNLKALREEQLIQQQAELLLARSLQFERGLLHRMRQRGEISEEVYMKVLQKLDRDEVNFTPH